MSDADILWKDFSKPIVTAEGYIASLHDQHRNPEFQ